VVVSESASEPVQAGCCVLRPSEEASHAGGSEGEHSRVADAPAFGVARYGRGPVTFADGTRLTAVFVSPDRIKLVGTRASTSLIDSLTVGGDGLLTAAPDSPFGVQPIGIVVT
jgi:hypothetical protein